jgi:hypothetical protein
MNFLVVFLALLVLVLSAQPSEALQAFADERADSYEKTDITVDLVQAWVKDAGTRLHERHLESPEASE